MEVFSRNITTSFFNSSSPSLAPLSSCISFSLLLVAAVMGIPGNFLVVLRGAFRPRGARLSITALLILQLAAADFLVLLTAPFFLRQLFLGGAWEFGEAACKLLHYVSAANMYVSVYLVSLMGLDRHLGVARPFLSQRLRTRSRLYPTLAVMWALALALPASLLVFRHVHRGVCLLYFPSPAHQIFQCSLETVAAYLLPFGVMACCYFHMTRRLASRAPAFGDTSRCHQRSYRKSGRVTRLIVGTFTLLWTPYHLFNVLQLGTLCSGSYPWLLQFCLRSRPVVISLGYLSSAVNPMLYALACPALTGSAPWMGCLIRLLDASSSIRKPPFDRK